MSAFGLAGCAGLLRAELFSPRRPLRILVLGGTNYVGPRIVAQALARGHSVTLFNRGITNPGLFPGVEALRGDRLVAGGLAALGAERTWDAVVDTWQGPPLAVAESVERLAARTEHYAYVSSIAVYGGANYRRPGYDESSPMPDPGPVPADPAVEVSYPARKRLAELAIERSLPGRWSTHRAHGLVGVDTFGRLDNPEIGLAGFAWWPVRIARGGEVLAPGRPTDTTQYTDVVDFAAFVVACLEDSRTGAFNVCATFTLRDFLAALRAESRSDARFTWVGAEYLFANGLESFTDIPLWVSHDEQEGAFYQASTDKARRAGFVARPPGATFGEVRRAFFTHHLDVDLAGVETGLALARVEADLLARWHERQRDEAAKRRTGGAEPAA